MYQALYRVWRPRTFSDMVGQEAVVRTLRNQVSSGRIAHAYLFCGPRGVGKTSTARIFAKAINCSNPSADMEPCGECESCRSFQEGRSYCIYELDAASNNGVDDIKALLEKAQIPPQVGRYSVYIIDEVHMLSQSAFNAFLKTLEEPPAHAIFILATTEKHKIIPTILSRCQTYDFNRISVPDIVRNLSDIASKENINIDTESLHVIAQKADGAMRDALTIFDQTVAFCGNDIHYADVIRNLNVLDYEYSFKLVDAFLAGDYATALLAFDEILGKGFNALHFVTALSSHFRDLLVSRTGGLDALLDLPDTLKARYRDQASRCSVKFLYDALGVTTACEAGYRNSANQRLHIEYALMKLAFLNGAVDSRVSSAPPGQADAVKPVAQEVKTEPKPEPKRVPRKPSSLSLSSLMDEKEDAAVPVETEAENVGELPGDDVIIARWQDLAAAQSAQPRLANALSSAKLNIREEAGVKVVEFAVTNEAQKKWIEERILRSLESQFSKLLSCGRIRLEPTVVPEEAREERKYMPAEKAEDLMSRNEEVRNLVTDLGLDIK